MSKQGREVGSIIVSWDNIARHVDKSVPQEVKTRTSKKADGTHKEEKYMEPLSMSEKRAFMRKKGNVEKAVEFLRQELAAWAERNPNPSAPKDVDPAFAEAVEPHIDAIFDEKGAKVALDKIAFALHKEVEFDDDTDVLAELRAYFRSQSGRFSMTAGPLPVVTREKERPPIHRERLPESASC